MESHKAIIPFERCENSSKLHQINFCSNFQHTLTVRQHMFYRKIGTEGSVLQELCHFVILSFCPHFKVFVV